MSLAQVASLRSHDDETKVGSVLVKESSGAVIATGCNGFVRGADDSVLPRTRPDKYKYIIHSEENLICNAAQHGISMEDTFVVCTMTPCCKCMRLLWQCGVKKVIAKDKYKDLDDIINMEDLNIECSFTEEGYIQLIYKVK
jgi:dCMP deaminase